MVNEPNIREFGKGELLISLGIFRGKHTVIVSKESGELVRQPKPNEWLLQFECKEKAVKVYNVLSMDYGSSSNDGGDWW